MTSIFFFILLSTGMSFLCSLLESVFLSTTSAFIAVAVGNGRRYGFILQNLKDNVNRPLSAVLTFNTVANTMGGAAVGAHVIKVYGDKYLALFSAVTTIIILLAGEIIPKVLGANNWKRLAPGCAYLIQGLVYAVWPIVWLAEKIARTLGPGADSGVSREEVIVTAQMSADEGAIRHKESTVIKNLLMLDKVKIADIMTPRAVMYAFEVGTTVGDIMAKHRPIRFSRVPVYHENLDHILGVVHRYKILEAVSHDQDNLLVETLVKDIHAIPENISVAAALDQFIKRAEHIFVVVDDYGSTTGIVSLEDAIETLLGVEIIDEFDSVADLRQLALDQWRARKAKLLGTKP